jgi:probable F420-dependent oxidoreductase
MMRFSVGLPWGGRWADGQPVSGAELSGLARAAEQAGFAAVFATDHPAPTRRWLDSGGHATLDPFVALSLVAAATESIWLHTHLLVAPYRHPLVVAKAVASLASLHERQVILGVGAGYLAGEFRALGVDFDRRNQATDQAVASIRRAIRGEEVNGAVILPSLPEVLRPFVWVGGNSARAIERAVALADGWCPMPASPELARAVRTPPLEAVADLAERIAHARRRCEESGRSDPLTVCFSPAWGALGVSELPPADMALESLAELGSVGVSWVTVVLPGSSYLGLRDNLLRFGEEVVVPASSFGPDR